MLLAFYSLRNHLPQCLDHQDTHVNEYSVLLAFYSLRNHLPPCSDHQDKWYDS
jgi:hypothetical protein